MNLERVALYANAKPEKARPKGMQIVKRDKQGNVTKIRDHLTETHEPAAPKPRAKPTEPSPRGVVFQNTTVRHFRRTNLSWED